MKMINWSIRVYVALSLVAFGLLFCAGCTTVSTTAADGSVTTSTEIDWTSINYFGKTSMKYATAAILENNPDYATAVAAVNTALSTLLVGTPTVDSLTTALKAMNLGLADSDVTTLANAIYDAASYYMTKAGVTALVASDTKLSAFISALSEGVAAGVTMATSSTTTRISS